MPTDRSPGAATGSAGLTIEGIVAVESPREFRISPRERLVAYTSEVAGARQLFTLSLRGTGAPATQITASEKAIGEPQWSPDGRRLAFVRDEEIWIVEADGSRFTKVVPKPGGGRDPQWSPDGRRIAFISRRRGWSQVWLIDAPVPRRGRPQRDPRPPQAVALTPGGFDVDRMAWSPDGGRMAVMAQQAPEDLTTSQISIVDVATGKSEVVAGERSHDTGAQWLSDGSLVYVSDADGWFQVVRRSPDGRDRIILTDGEREHGEPTGSYGYAPLPSPDGSRVVHIEVHDGLIDLIVRGLGEAAQPKRGRGRPPKTPRTVAAATKAERISPWDGVWRAIGWLPDGAWVAAIGESETRPQDLWLLPVPGVAPDGARPRQVTDSRPAVLASSLTAGRVPAGERIAVKARDGLRIEGTLWRPSAATGKRGGKRVPTVIYPHGGPTWQAYRSFQPFKLLLAREGFAFLDVDFRGSTGYGRAFRQANHGEWGHADVHDLIDAGRWAAEQPWSDGRLAVFGGSYGGYMVLCALVEEPAMFAAGIDLYGDSEIAESFRHGDRPGRLDLLKMMGTPDDPELTEVFRRGSPVYRAERIEAPLLLLHGRKDKRVVPLMTERMVEALEIEGKTHEVHWYDDEGHGWERRENRRDAFGRILRFLQDARPRGAADRGRRHDMSASRRSRGLAIALLAVLLAFGGLACRDRRRGPRSNRRSGQRHHDRQRDGRDGAHRLREPGWRLGVADRACARQADRDRPDLRWTGRALPHGPARGARPGGRRDRRAVPGLPRRHLDHRGVLVDDEPVVRAQVGECAGRRLDRPPIGSLGPVQGARRGHAGRHRREAHEGAGRVEPGDVDGIRHPLHRERRPSQTGFLIVEQHAVDIPETRQAAHPVAAALVDGPRLAPDAHGPDGARAAGADRERGEHQHQDRCGDRPHQVVRSSLGGRFDPGPASSRGMTLIEPSVSSTASRTSSGPTRPCERIAARTSSVSRPSSLIALASRRPSRTSRRGSPSIALLTVLDRLASALRPKSRASSVTTATSPPHSVVFSPTIEFWTASLMTRMTTSSRTDIWPTSRLPDSRRASTTKR